MIDHIVSPRSMKDIRRIVKEIKELLGIDGLLKVPVLFIFETVLPEMFPDYRFQVVPKDELSKGQYAYTSHQEKVVKIREDVYEEAYAGIPRALFTIAHELGHFFIHEGEVYAFSRLEVTVPAYMRAEWQANYFAAEFLMSSDLILNMSVDEITKNCNSSTESASIHLQHARKEHEKGRL